MAIFNSKLLVYQRVKNSTPHILIFFKTIMNHKGNHMKHHRIPIFLEYLSLSAMVPWKRLPAAPGETSAIAKTKKTLNILCYSLLYDEYDM